MAGLDLNDRKILYQLDLNSRQFDSEIAKKLRMSRETVRYRIKNMIKGGYIKYFFTIIDSTKLGFEWYRTYLKFENTNSDKEQEILKWLFGRANWIIKVEGKWDFVIATMTKSAYEYRDFIDDLLLRFRDYIADYDVSIVTRMWHYHRDYLLGKKEKALNFDMMGYNKGEDYRPVRINKDDYKILELIATDARMNTVDISAKSGLSDKTVRLRIRKLIDEGIILGFRPLLDLDKLGYLYFKVHFTLHSSTAERRKLLLSYIHQHPNTVYTTELVGGSDIETEFQLPTIQGLYDSINEIRDRFSDMIRDHYFMQYGREYKVTYLQEMKF